MEDLAKKTGGEYRYFLLKELEAALKKWNR
jgi:hypothetical protein